MTALPHRREWKHTDILESALAFYRPLKLGSHRKVNLKHCAGDGRFEVGHLARKVLIAV